jgi:hypothetical protein
MGDDYGPGIDFLLHPWYKFLHCPPEYGGISGIKPVCNYGYAFHVLPLRRSLLYIFCS